MKRLFLLFFLFFSLTALYLYFAGCKEGARSGWSVKKMATDATKQYKLNKKTNDRLQNK